MTITDEKVVSLSYTLEVEGEVMETVKEDKPMQFIFGIGYLLPKFEEQIAGKQVGDPFDFELSAADGYGEVDPNAIIDIPKDAFKINGKIEEGLLVKDKVIPMQDSDGNRLNGVVEEIKDEVVVMNFNHPLAGAALHFTGKIVDLRDATEEELKNGLFGERAHSCHGNDCSSCSGCGE